MTVERRKVADVAVQRAIDSLRSEVNRTSQEAGSLRNAIDGRWKDTIADGVLLEDVVLVDGTTTKLSHRLGRQLRGWTIVDVVPASSAAMTTGRYERVQSDGTNDADDARDLWLLATGFTTNLTVRVWVF